MFKKFQSAVSDQFDNMKKYDLFRIRIEKDLLWETYLKAFPEGTNPMFRERTEHDCQCCKNFIRSVGGVVAIIDGKMQSIWDIELDGLYKIIADQMSLIVKSNPIDNIFLHTEKNVGVKENFQLVDNNTLTWNHLFIQIPSPYITFGTDIGPRLSDSRASRDVFQRSLDEITVDSINTVLELIAQNSLYRGEEHKFVLEAFLKLKKEYNMLIINESIFAWSKIKTMPASVTRIRNTVIGSLLVDLSDGHDLEEAVKSFEVKVAPTNYKRPTSLITKAMIEKAQKTIADLGLTSALERRYATIQDITINNILYANRESKKNFSGDIFDDLVATMPQNVKNFDRVEEVSIESFITNILPKAESIEVMFENRHQGNLMSLIAPVDPTSKDLFKWPNKFSWSYTGELSDSIKERVKTAGGKVDGDLRCSLSWFNFDDLDLHMVEQDRSKIFFGNKGPSSNLGRLDVDMNAGGKHSRNAVENICYPDRKQMKDGVYTLFVQNYNKRETIDVGFDVEIEFDGVINTISHSLPVKNQEIIEVAQINYSKKDGFKIIKSLPSSQTVKQLWNIPTQMFHKVNVVMLSPNHWDSRNVGNKHYFFMLDKCLNDGKARGFFNEFLSEELSPVRKVLEVVGSKMKTEESQNQLSGLGFSSTQRNSILCKVKGSFARTIKIAFR